MRFPSLFLAVAIATLNAAPCLALIPTIEALGWQPDILQEELASSANISSANTTWVCEAIFEACDGIGTDEQALVDLLGPMSAPERHILPPRYAELYDTTLTDLLISETSGPFADLLVMLVQMTVEIELGIVYNTREEIGHDSDPFNRHTLFGAECDMTRALIPLFVGRSVEELAILVGEYQQQDGRDLVDDVKAILSPYMTKALAPSLEHSIEAFNDTIHTLQQAEEDAEKLYNAGERRLGTDEDTFIDIIMNSPPGHLLNVSRYYQQMYSHSLLDAAKAEFSHDIKHALVFRIELVTESFANAAATMIYLAVDGGGTDEYLLSAMLVRYLDRLPEIAAAYRRKYHEDLRDRIDSETSGDYCSLLLRVFDAKISHSPSGRSWGPVIAMSAIFATLALVVAICVMLNRNQHKRRWSMANDAVVDKLASPTKDNQSPKTAYRREGARK